MSKIGPEQFSTYPEVLSLYDIELKLAEWSRDPGERGGDPRVQAFAKAGLKFITSNPHLRADLDGMLNRQVYQRMRETELHEPYVHTALQATDHFLHTVDHIGLVLQRFPDFVVQLADKGLIGELPDDQLKFPRDYLDPAAYEYLINYILKNEYFREVFFQFDLEYRHAQTNIPGRYKSVHMIMESLKDELSELVVWYDIGTSLAFGPRLEISGEAHSYPHVFNTQEMTRRDYNSTLAARTRGMLDSRIKYREIVGVDLLPMDDRSDALWVKANNLPSEINSEVVMRRFDRLLKVTDERLRLESLNFTDDSQVEAFMSNMTNPPDVVSLITVMQQLSEEDRVRMLRNAAKLKPKIIVVQDFAMPNPEMPSGFEFFDRWDPFTNRTSIIRPAMSMEAKEVFRWRNGRCDELVLSPGAELDNLL